MEPRASNNFLSSPRPNPGASIRLFCFPYAGGGAHIYHPWLSLLPRSVELWAINLPGRGMRIRDRPYTDCKVMVREIVKEFVAYLDKPFALFGHSMGAIVSFELARQLRADRHRLPEHLFVSACHAPHLPDPHPIHHLPEPEFLRELGNLGGLPQEVLDSSELMELVLPSIRADLTLVETYPYVEEAPLACPISAFGGSEDHLFQREHVEAWRIHTSGAFTLTMLPGNHFFIQTSREALLESMLQKLRP